MKIRSIKFNFIMNAILAASTIVFPLITFPYISRVLLVEGNGKIAFASSVVNYFSMIASLGIPTYGIRACAQVRGDKEKLSHTVQELLIINMVTTGISLLAFLVSLVTVPQFAAEKELMLINGVSMVLATLGVTWLYSALEQYAYITVCSMAFKVIGIVLMFLFVKAPEDYIIYGAVSVVAGSGSYVLNLINLRKYVSLKKSGKYNFRRHIKPIFVFFSMSAAINVYTNLDVVMLQFMQGDSAVGYYNTAIKIKVILTTLITSLGTVLLPRLSYYTQMGQEEDFRRTVGKAANFVMLLGTPLVIYFSMFAEESIVFLAGEAFRRSTVSMIILMPAVLLIGLSNITGIQVLTPKNQEKKVLYSILWGAAIDFLLNLILIPRYSEAGAAVATLVAELAVLLIQCVYLRYMLKGILREISAGKMIAALICSTIAGVFLKLNLHVGLFMELLISACGYFAIYAAVLLITREKLAMEVLGSVFGRIVKKRIP